MWTLYELEILFHHHCSAAPFLRADAPGYAGTLLGLQERGVLDQDRKTTAKGRALIDMILETPLPVQAWLDPRFPAPPAVAKEG